MNIMIVDDDKSCLESLKNSFGHYSCQCETYENPLVALETFEKSPEKYDVVIVDIKMPEMNGIDVMLKMKKIKADVKVIILTAYGDVKTAISAVNNHAYAFFCKPINFNELMATVEKACKESSPKLTECECKKLKEEYLKLKKAYDELQKLLKK